MKRWVVFALLTLGLLGTGSLGAAGLTALQPDATPAFEFGLIGDLPYTPEERAKFPNLIADMNAHNLAFVVHDGDLKAGDTLCDDATFEDALGLFNSSAHPMVYVFGDNEWTDCHRANNGGYDSLERLAVLRRMFHSDQSSLGQRRMAFERQNDNPAYADYVENTRWSVGEVTFVGLHVIGSNNNLGRNAENDAEYYARNAATNAWLRESFARARAANHRAIMLVMQANPLFEAKPEDRTGFNDFLAALQEEAIAFGKPVVLVHGDTHYFRMDNPMVNAQTGRRVENFLRLETYGTPDVHWVHAIVDYNHPNVFLFRRGIVDANLVPPTR